MDQNKLFCFTRWRLAGWYAGVMAFILGLSGFGVYHMVAYAYSETIDQALESVAVELQDNIKPVLKQPGRWEQIAQELSLEICVKKASCLTQTATSSSHLSRVIQVKYYTRFLDRSGQVLAMTGFQPERLPITSPQKHWQTFKDHAGNRYRQISLLLHTKENQLWGYMQVGRSLNDLDGHKAELRLTLWLGWPIAMLLVGGSSWWLAGLAMQPVYLEF